MPGLGVNRNLPKTTAFRAGIEADTSCPKRAYGLARCT